MWHSIFWLKQNFIHFSLYHALQQHKYKPTNFIIFSNTLDLTYRNHKCKPIYTRRKKNWKKTLSAQNFTLSHTMTMSSFQNTSLTIFQFQAPCESKVSIFHIVEHHKIQCGKKRYFSKIIGTDTEIQRPNTGNKRQMEKSKEYPQTNNLRIHIPDDPQWSLTERWLTEALPPPPRGKSRNKWVSLETLWGGEGGCFG